MKYKDFEKMINTIEAIRERSHALWLLKVDILALDEDYFKVIDMLLEKAFGNYNKEWIDWYLYERVTPTGEILKAHDENGKEICHNIQSLWETITE